MRCVSLWPQRLIMRIDGKAHRRSVEVVADAEHANGKTGADGQRCGRQAVEAVANGEDRDCRADERWDGIEAGREDWRYPANQYVAQGAAANGGDRPKNRGLGRAETKAERFCCAGDAEEAQSRSVEQDDDRVEAREASAEEED